MIALKEAIQIIEDVARSKHGVKPSFDSGTVMLALMRIDEEKTIGRPSLMKSLNLHEAQAKTLIKRLKESGLVTSDRVLGLSLTEKGKSVLESVKSVVTLSKECVEIATLGWTTAGAVISQGAKLLNKMSVSSLRDLGVSLGAQAVLLVVKEGGELVMPPKSLNEDETVRSIRIEIKKKFDLKDGDLLTLVTPCDKTLLSRIVLSYAKLLD